MPWISRLEELYASGAACQFIVHGNVQDVFWHGSSESKKTGLVPPGEGLNPAATSATRNPLSEYIDLDTFLVRRLLGGFSVILEVDLAHAVPSLEGDA